MLSPELLFSLFSGIGFLHLVPKVSAALWARLSWRDSVSPPAHHDLDRGPHCHPPATETEFRLPRPFPKRCANFGNERESRASGTGAFPSWSLVTRGKSRRAKQSFAGNKVSVPLCTSLCTFFMHFPDPRWFPSPSRPGSRWWW